MQQKKSLRRKSNYKEGEDINHYEEVSNLNEEVRKPEKEQVTIRLVLVTLKIDYII